MRQVREIMRSDFIEVDPRTDIETVLSVMAMARVRSLPVVDDGRLIGWVRYRALMHAAILRGPGGGSQSAEEFMEPAFQIVPEATLQEAARLMVEKQTPCVLVADGGSDARILGLVTENDLLRAAYLGRDPSQHPPG